MLYFGEEEEFILAECDVCKGEMRIEKSSVDYEDAYEYTLSSPLRCVCGEISGRIGKSGKSCHEIKQELSVLSELLHTKRGIAEKIAAINGEISRTVRPPRFGAILAADFMFAVKIMLIALGIAAAGEILLVVAGCLMFFCGVAFQMPDLSTGGNEIMYSFNVFKEHGADVLTKFGFPTAVPPITAKEIDKELFFDYLPAALAGIGAVVFYVFAAILLARLTITVLRLCFFTSRVVKKRVSVNIRKEKYAAELESLGRQFDDIEERLGNFTVLPEGYRNIKATDTILAYFLNNRKDNIRDAINLFHEEDLKVRALDYQRAIYSELRQTKRYAKALYILNSDSDAAVDVKDEPPTAQAAPQPQESDDAKVGDMLKNAYKKLRRPAISSPAPAMAIAQPDELPPADPAPSQAETIFSEQPEKLDALPEPTPTEE